MPRRSKYIASYGSLAARLGPNSFERYGIRTDGHGSPFRRRHIGWRWPCDCLAFARPEGDYLWVPCSAHDAVGRAAARPRSD